MPTTVSPPCRPVIAPTETTVPGVAESNLTSSPDAVTLKSVVADIEPESRNVNEKKKISDQTERLTIEVVFIRSPLSFR